MQNILAKIGAFFEAHVEKIVLAIAGIVGIWLLMVFVIMNPNAVTYDNQTFSPGSVDQYIYDKKAKLVQAELNQSSVATNEAYQSVLDSPIDPNDPLLEGFTAPLDNGFMGLFSCSISQIDSSIVPAVPAHKTAIKSDGRQYALPYIGTVSDVQVEHIRAAAYLPAAPVTETETYDSVEHDINDVDLVTVQARYDVETLRARFHECFAGGGLPEEWQDESMAKPVFAAVNLQRRPWRNGTWGVWEDVPQVKTVPLSDTYRVIENANDLPAGGIRVRMIRLGKDDVRTNILQCPPYEIASTYDEWLPPEFHGKYQLERQKEEAQKRREERDSERNSQRDTTRRGRAGMNNQQGMGRNNLGMGNDTTRRGRRGNTQGMNDRNAMNAGRQGVGNDRNRRGRNTNANGRLNDQFGLQGGRGLGMVEQSPVDEVFEEFEEIRLSPFKDFSRMDEVVFWAHDATAEPGQTYQYRIRVGVLNPVAGLGYVTEKDAAFKDQVILWSDFSSETQSVDIPQRQYFFASNYQEVSNSVSVEVAKFTNGYWRSETFSVKPGESIGRLVEIEPEEDENDTMALRGGPRQMPGLGMLEPEPELIDFSTDVVFVAVERVNAWEKGNTLKSKTSYDMLYSTEGTEIQRMPIGSQNWPERLSEAFANVKKLQKETIEEPRSFGSSRSAQNNVMGMGRMGFGRQ